MLPRYVIKIYDSSKRRVLYKDFEESDELEPLRQCIEDIRKADLEIPDLPYIVFDRYTKEIIWP